MSTVVSVFILLLLAVASVLVYLNRASPAVVTQAVPVAFGTLAALILVFAFNRPEPIAKTFGVLFVVEQASRLPVSIPFRPFSEQTLILAAEMQQTAPTTFTPPQGQEEGFDFLVPLYHELLQRAFVNTLADKQFGTWRVRTERVGRLEQFGPMPDAKNYASKVLEKEQLEQAFAKNRFARAHSMMGKWALPPGTDLQVVPPHAEPGSGEVGTVRLKNRFCVITIDTSRSMSMVGLGQYKDLLGATFDQSQRGYKNFLYITRINVSFAWHLGGHPDMAVHRAWANGIVDELAHAFDEETIWKRTTDGFMLHRHLPPTADNIPPPFGPIRMAPAAER